MEWKVYELPRHGKFGLMEQSCQKKMLQFQIVFTESHSIFSINYHIGYKVAKMLMLTVNSIKKANYLTMPTYYTIN